MSSPPLSGPPCRRDIDGRLLTATMTRLTQQRQAAPVASASPVCRLPTTCLGERTTSTWIRRRGRRWGVVWSTAKTQRTDGVITHQTQPGLGPASTARVSRIGACGFPPRSIRRTWLRELVNTVDLEPVAVAVGMAPEAAMIRLADRIAPGRLA